MKRILLLGFLVFGSQALIAGEGVIKKVDRTAHEAVDEVKKAGSTIVKKLKKNTNTKTDEEIEQEIKNEKKE